MNKPPQSQQIWLPRLAAVGCAVVGLVNIASALTPNIRWRGHLLLSIRAGRGNPPVPRAGAAGRDRAAARRALPAQAPPPRLAGRDRADARARAVRPAQGPRLRGDGDHLDGRRRPVRGPWSVRGPPRPDHAALGDLAGAAARAAGVLALAARRRLGLGGPSVARDDHARDRRICWLGSAGRLRSKLTPLCTTNSPGSRSSVHLVEIATLLVDRLRDLPAARSATALPEPRRPPAGRRRSCARTAPTRCRSSSCAATSSTSSAEDRRAFVGYRIENGVLLLSGDPVGPEEAIPALLRELGRFAPGRGLKLGARRRQRGALPAVRGARPAHDLPRRRGDRRSGRVLARGPADPQGPPVGQPAAARPATTPSSTTLAAARRRARSPRSRRCSSAAARARPSAASRWRWTRSAAPHDHDTLVVLARDERRHDPRRPALRARATAATPCRCRSCAATRTRPTG